MKEFGLMFKKAFDFKSKSSRKEFWMCFLFVIILEICVLTLALPFIFDIDLFIIVVSAISSLYNFIIFIPSLSLTVRRLHDTGRSGWWVLISFFVFLGSIFLLIYLCQPSNARYDIWSIGNNQSEKTVEDLRREVEEQNVESAIKSSFNEYDDDYKIDVEQYEDVNNEIPKENYYEKKVGLTEEEIAERESKKMQYKMQKVDQLKKLKEEGTISEQIYAEMVKKIFEEE